MGDLKLKRREAEMVRQLTIVCEEIDKGSLEGLVYHEFPKTVEFQHLENGDLISNVPFALMGDEKGDLYTDITVFQPSGNIGEFRSAKGTLTLGVGGDIVHMIYVDDPHGITRNLPSNIVVQVLKVFPNLPRLKPLTDDEELMFKKLRNSDPVCLEEEDLLQRLRARALSQ